MKDLAKVCVEDKAKKGGQQKQLKFVSSIFCVVENHYVHTARNFSLSGLKLTNLGEL